jgi:WD40 repeat protein
MFLRHLMCLALLAGAAAAQPATKSFRHGATMSAVVFTPDGKCLVSAGWDKKIRIWDIASGKELRTCEGHDAEIECLAVSPDGKFLASGSWDKTIRLWEVATGKEVRQIGEHPDGIFCVAFSPDGKLLASGNQDRMAQHGTLHLWEVGTGKLVRTIAGHALPVVTLAFSPDGQRLATGGVDRTVRLFETATGKQLASFAGHQHWVQSVAFAPDGVSLASGSGDKTIRFWDIPTVKERYLFEGHEDKVRAIAFALDGRTLVSGGFDKTIRFWETATGKERLAFRGHKAGVRALAFAPDGRGLASAGTDGVVRLVDVVSLIHDGEKPPEALSEKMLASLWNHLGGEDVPRSYRAIGALSAAPGSSVPFLKEHLQRASSVDAKRMKQLVDDLDSNQFLVRERATRDLYELGDLAVPGLKQALKGDLSAESRRRVEQVLERLQGPVTSLERLRLIRSVEVLENIGTPEAKQVLETLAKGAPEAWITQQAKAALVRLGRRPC